MVKEHFDTHDKPENEIRYCIYQLMDYFEKIDSIMTRLLAFEVKEEKAIDQVEQLLIEMEKHHLRMHHLVKEFEKEQSIGEEIVYQSSSLHEAIRRTYNLLSTLNIIDLNHESWVSKTTRCLVDKVYYRQIKSLVYKSVPKRVEEI